MNEHRLSESMGSKSSRLDILGDEEARAAGICERSMKRDKLSRGVDYSIIVINART